MNFEQSQSLAVNHLLLRLKPINRALRFKVARQSQITKLLQRPDVTPLCVSDEQVALLLDHVDGLACNECESDQALVLTADEIEQEIKLREKARAEGYLLPLDLLTAELDMTVFEQNALLLCAAPEIDRSYERIYSYVLDDLNRQGPCAELICSVCCASVEEQLTQRRLLGPHAWLRRYGLIESYGLKSNQWREELRLMAGVMDKLTILGSSWANQYFDPAEINVSNATDLNTFPEETQLQQLAKALKTGTISIAGIWGTKQCGTDDAVKALTKALARPLHRVTIEQDPTHRQDLIATFATAAAKNAVLWFESDELIDLNPEKQHIKNELIDLLAHYSGWIFLSGAHPWRPTTLLSSQSYAEVQLKPSPSVFRETLWKEACPVLDESQAADLASRFRLNFSQVRAASRTALSQALVFENGNSENEKQSSAAKHLEKACGLITQRQITHFATSIQPRRGPGDLILPSYLHQQVLEVANFFRRLKLVDEEWQFGRLASGSGGLKVLFTGDSGTGKTLASEVIAGQLGLILLKVDIARLISKWVGETEKNMDAVFREAEDSQAVLFFDEAESLFGKRGEIQQGNDRYANLEVGYLLQRLEDYGGLVILASNLKDEIDKAFMRRFHIVLNFPRPQATERLALWKLALPPTAPLDLGINLESLIHLDMTGASIVGAARMAALLAADEESAVIRGDHILAGVSRQFTTEARVLAPSELSTIHSNGG